MRVIINQKKVKDYFQNIFPSKKYIQLLSIYMYVFFVKKKNKNSEKNIDLLLFYNILKFLIKKL